MKAFISCPGDPDVGIFPCHTVVELCIELDDKEARHNIRNILRATFALIWDDGHTYVQFEDEIEEEPTK